MSRHNKVNPGMYTQRGRLTQDDAARELAKQRSIGSEHTWQPVKRDAKPRLESPTENADDTVDEAGENESGVAEEMPAPDAAKATPSRKQTRSRKAPPRKPAARKAVKARAKTTARAKPTAAASRKSKAKSGASSKANAKSAKRRKS